MAIINENDKDKSSSRSKPTYSKPVKPAVGSLGVKKGAGTLGKSVTPTQQYSAYKSFDPNPPIIKAGVQKPEKPAWSPLAQLVNYGQNYYGRVPGDNWNFPLADLVQYGQNYGYSGPDYNDRIDNMTASQMYNYINPGFWGSNPDVDFDQETKAMLGLPLYQQNWMDDYNNYFSGKPSYGGREQSFGGGGYGGGGGGGYKSSMRPMNDVYWRI